MSSEHFFQACKTFDKQHQQLIINSPTPGEAKKNGKIVTLRPDWEGVKIHMMRVTLYLKFNQHPNLLKKLVNTGEEILVETNTWHDNIWGQCMCSKCSKIVGQNWLGKLLMELRTKTIEKI